MCSRWLWCEGSFFAFVRRTARGTRSLQRCGMLGETTQSGISFNEILSGFRVNLPVHFALCGSELSFSRRSLTLQRVARDVIYTFSDHALCFCWLRQCDATSLVRAEAMHGALCCFSKSFASNQTTFTTHSEPLMTLLIESNTQQTHTLARTTLRLRHHQVDLTGCGEKRHGKISSKYKIMSQCRSLVNLIENT